MNKSESIQLLASALSKAQAEMPAIKFDSKNPFLKNDYASLGAIIAGARPVLAKHGLSVSQLTFGEAGVAGVETVLMHTSGEWISQSISMPIGEEKGKSSAQVAGSIVTYLRRYSLASILGIYSDEDGDGNKPEPTRKPARTKPEAQANDDIMTIERASKVTNSEGTPYVDIASDVLQKMVIGINKGLQNGADDEKRAEYLEKKQAIGVILKARADKSI
ncbi:MAG: ERF family protein [Candidatus Marinimicrobia bacterium]|nr:ERF family protein [Candidatus Neomarinimicrobiota bacterium]